MFLPSDPHLITLANVHKGGLGPAVGEGLQVGAPPPPLPPRRLGLCWEHLFICFLSRASHLTERQRQAPPPPVAMEITVAPGRTWEGARAREPKECWKFPAWARVTVPSCPEALEVWCENVGLISEPRALCPHSALPGEGHTHHTCRHTVPQLQHHASRERGEK